MLVSLLIVGVGAVLFARRVVQPIRDVAGRFGQLRDLPDAELLPLAPRGDDEIGNLSRGFNAFLDGLNVRRQSDAKLQLAASVFSHAREGIVITDADGHIIEVNDAFTRITGYPRNEVLGRNPRILSSGRHDRAFYDEMWRDLRTRGYWEGRSGICASPDRSTPSHSQSRPCAGAISRPPTMWRCPRTSRGKRTMSSSSGISRTSIRSPAFPTGCCWPIASSRPSYG
ncbi:PAS domain-containing protein [Thauera humireducens]|uniref:PAS domain-containing protein n=1 Tax=Thauera humireducens TaxID=1134435 RepID=UPI003C77A4A7